MSISESDLKLMPAWREAAQVQGQIKTLPQDFVVEEILTYPLTGEGEHVFIFCEKTQLNTSDVVSHIKKQLGLKSVDIAYSGLKDKQAVTRQWLSVRSALSNDELKSQIQDSFSHEYGELKILKLQRNIKKLRIGDHGFNDFDIVLRDVRGDANLVDQRLENIRDGGFPNYFGMQRFGWQGSNLFAWQRWIDGGMPRIKRQRRSMLISSARSYLFNCALKSRVEDGSWQQIMAPEYFTGRSDQKAFLLDGLDIQQQQENDAGIIGAALCLPGLVKWQVNGELAAQSSHPWHQALEQLKVERGFRRLRAHAHDLQWQWLQGDTLRLRFRLARGVFATVLINEIIDIENK